MQENVSGVATLERDGKIFDLSSESFAVFCRLIRLVNKAPHFSTSARVKEWHMKRVNRPNEGRVALAMASGYDVAMSFSKREVQP